MSTLTSLLKKSKWAVKDAVKRSKHTGPFSTAPEGQLFTKVDPTVDGEDCDHDCSSCTIRYPAKFSIDEEEPLYGHVKGWATHLLVATGKTDWVRDVADEKGSVMEAVEKAGKPTNGRLMLSASDIPTPSQTTDYAEPTICFLLPAFIVIENVTPTSVPDLITSIINHAPTNTTPLYGLQELSNQSLPSGLSVRACKHDAIILLCSQKTRDARCGQSAPLLKREFERHLRPLGLYRDFDDERAGGVGIYFISHVGGHKFSANVMVYRRAGIGKNTVVQNGDSIMTNTNGAGIGKNAIVQNGNSMVADTNGAGNKEHNVVQDDSAGQCIWLARVRPEDCEGIIKFTVMQGKVVKPERQLRGGFDREKGLCSW